jgi:hypothetical protein
MFTFPVDDHVVDALLSGLTAPLLRQIIKMRRSGEG